MAAHPVALLEGAQTLRRRPLPGPTPQKESPLPGLPSRHLKPLLIIHFRHENSCTVHLRLWLSSARASGAAEAAREGVAQAPGARINPLFMRSLASNP